MSFISTSNDAYNLAHVTGWSMHRGGRRATIYTTDGSRDVDVNGDELERLAAIAVPAPPGYELIVACDDLDGFHRQPVIVLYVNVALGLIDAAGIEDHLTDKGQHLITPDGRVWDPGSETFANVDKFAESVGITCWYPGKVVALGDLFPDIGGAT